MNRLRLLAFALILLMWSQLNPGFSHANQEGTFKAGVASIIITPKTDMWMSGYAARKKPSNGTLLDLYAKALVLEDPSGKRVVIISLDLIGISASMSQRITSGIQDDLGIPRDSVMLTVSHTHSGPVIRDNLELMYALSSDEWDKVTLYTKRLEKTVVSLVKQANDKLQPARLFHGVGKAGFAVNRREYTHSGVKIGINPIGPVDNDVPVLKITDTDGETFAIFFGYACHNTTLSINQFSGDFAGFAQYDLEQRYPEVVAMFFAGCAADQNPNPRREIAYAQQHGRSLSQSVSSVLNQKLKEISGNFQTTFNTVDLSFASIPSSDDLKVMLNDTNVYKQRLAKILLTQLDEKGAIDSTYSYPIQTWQLGDGPSVIALAGEVVVDYSTLFKHLYGGGDSVWVAAYANDVCCYIPSLRVLHEGGYEAVDSMMYYGMPSSWGVTVEEIISAEVERQIQIVRKNKLLK